MERNALRAGLAPRAEEWPWSSAFQRISGKNDNRPALSKGPLDLPDHWLDILNREPDSVETDSVRASVNRGRPFGDEPWANVTARLLHIESTLRPRGRPHKV